MASVIVDARHSRLTKSKKVLYYFKGPSLFYDFILQRLFLVNVTSTHHLYTFKLYRKLSNKNCFRILLSPIVFSNILRFTNIFGNIYISYPVSGFIYISYPVSGFIYNSYSVSGCFYISYSVSGCIYISYSVSECIYISYSVSECNYISSSVSGCICLLFCI